MNILYGAYTLLLTGGLFLSCVPAFWIYTRLSRRHGENLKERLGHISPKLAQTLSGSP